MGERASIAYVEFFDDLVVSTTFYGHWVADGTIDILAKALEGDKYYLKASIARNFEDLYGSEYDISPFSYSTNYPLLGVRCLGGEVSVYIDPANYDSAQYIDMDSPKWYPAEAFIEAANSTREYAYYERFDKVMQILNGGLEGENDCAC